MNTDYEAARCVVSLANAVNNYRNKVAESFGLTAVQSDAMRCILKYRHDKKLTANDLMEYLQLSQSTVAGIIKRLCEKGLIKKVQDTSDSRRMFLELTESGTALEKNLQTLAGETEQTLLKGMTETEREKFIFLLSMAHKNIADRFGENCEERG